VIAGNAFAGGLEQEMVSLWDLLNVLCLVMPIGGALAAAGIARVGSAGYVLAIAIGLALGMCCAWPMRTVGKTVAAHIKRHPGSVKERYAYALYFAATLWIVFALFLGQLVSLASIRLMFRSVG
jgi:hypothetical protein